MAIESIEAALRAAGSYLTQMRDQEGRAFGDNSKFDEHLTAFVGPGRSVVFQLEPKYASTYRDWREAWNAEHKDEARLLKACSAARWPHGRSRRGRSSLSGCAASACSCILPTSGSPAD